jgi:hypothetical protein
MSEKTLNRIDRRSWLPIEAQLTPMYDTKEQNSMSFTRLRSLRSTLIVTRTVALALLLGLVGQARADVVYTYSSSVGGGVGAQATITSVPGGIEISVVSTVLASDASQAISQIQLDIAGTGLALPTGFTRLVGTETDFANPTTHVDVTPPAGNPSAALHWQFSTPDSTTVNLFDVNGPGGQPNHLIVAPGSNPDSSLTNTHIPSFIGEVDFYLAASNVPTDLKLTDIPGLYFAFGTGPETPLTGGQGTYLPNTPVPEPGPMVLGSLAGLAGVSLRWLRAHKSRRAAKATSTEPLVS